MKKQLIVLSLAALLGLTGCGGNPASSAASSSKTASSSTTTSSTAASSAKSSSAESSAAKSSSTAASSSSEQQSSSSSTVSSSSVAPVSQKIADITQKGTYDVKGVVGAVTAKGFFLDDGTAAIYVYQNAVPTVAKGDYVEVKGGATINYGLMQLSTSLTITTATGTAPTLPDPVPLTTATIDAWVADTWTSSALTLAPSKIRPMSFLAEAKANGNFVNLYLEGSTVAISAVSITSEFKTGIVGGKWYDVVAYPNGYNSTNSYVPMGYVSAVEHAFAPASVSVTAEGGATSVRAKETLQLAATILPAAASQEVVWSMAEADKAYATISETGLVTGVAAKDAVVFTASAKADSNVSGTITLKIEDVAKDPVTSLSVKNGTAEATSLAMVVSDTVTLTADVLPTTANMDVTWAIDDATVASVDAGVVTALKAGSAVLTVTTKGVDAGGKALVATIPVSVTAMPAAKKTTISELAKITTADGILYELDNVIIEDNSFGVSKSSKYYNNTYIVDPATGDSIYAFGTASDAAALTYASGKVTFNNPGAKLAADYANGKMVSMYVVAAPYAASGSTTVTPEISGVYTSVAADTTATYKAEIANTPANGTAALDKADSLKWGDTVTVTCTPATGYIVKSVKVTDASGVVTAATVDPSDANKYTFLASCVNKVEVLFELNLTYVAVSKYTFATTTATDGTKCADAAAVLKLFSDVLGKQTAVVTAVSAQSNIYGGASYGIKFSTSSAAGKMVLTLDSTLGIRKVTATLAAYKAKTATVSFGSATAKVDGSVTQYATTDVSDTSETAYSSFTITPTAGPRFYLTDITFWKVAA